MGVILGVWLGYALYANSLSLPFFEDDFDHNRWLSALDSPFEPFITATGLPAYRPLGEMLLRSGTCFTASMNPLGCAF